MRIGFVGIVALGSVACGAFLGLSGDDENDGPPDAASADDASGSDGSTTGEGGTSGDGATGGEAGNVEGRGDAAGQVGATCAGQQCLPGQACCTDDSTAACTIGSQVCERHTLYCTRSGDCPLGLRCCIRIVGNYSEATCIGGTMCPVLEDVLCSTADAPGSNGCPGGQTCSGSGKVTTVYNLTVTASTPFGVCE